MSNKMLNIGGDANDASYRYQMHPLKTKIEGRGNGIKTVITNVTTVANELHTDPSYITKFFGMECGAVSKFDTQRNVGIVKCKREAKEFQEQLTRFINDFILCPRCGLPELKSEIYPTSKQLKHSCAPCGLEYFNNSEHKVRKFIINNPTSSIKAKGNKSKPKSGKTGGKKRSSKHKRHQSQTKQSQEGKEDVDGYRDIGGEDEEVWRGDTSWEAVAARKQQERLAKKGGYRPQKEEKKDDGEVAADSAIQILKEYMRVCERSNGEILDEVKRISLARRYDLRKTIELVLDALVDWKYGLDECMEGMKKYVIIFKKYTDDKHDAEVFLSVIENYICKRDLDEDFENKVYKLLTCLYDNEILDEEDILNWADTPVDKAMFVDSDDAERIRNKASVFINWLREDDEDEDEEEEEEEQEEGQIDFNEL